MQRAVTIVDPVLSRFRFEQGEAGILQSPGHYEGMGIRVAECDFPHLTVALRRRAEGRELLLRVRADNYDHLPPRGGGSTAPACRSARTGCPWAAGSRGRPTRTAKRGAGCAFPGGASTTTTRPTRASPGMPCGPTRGTALRARSCSCCTTSTAAR